jgi:tetratricopeptide (TPR) repeat protein
VKAADNYVGQAQALIAVGRHADAVPLLQRAIAAEPEIAYPRCVLALCFINMGQHEDACRMAQSAIGRNPEFSPAHRLHSVALLELGKRKPALDAAHEAVRLGPSDPDAMLALGEAQLANRQFDEAERSADRVLVLDPATPDGHYLLGRIALGRKDWKDAEAQCRQALRIEPRNWIVMNNLGVALQGQGRHKEAVAAFENAAKMNPKAELVRRNLFSQTQRYIGLGAITILIAQGIRLGIVAHASPVAFAAGLAILLLGASVVYFIRKRQLSPTVRQFYELEGRRRWPLTVSYMLFFYGPLLLIMVTTLVVYGRTHASIALLLLVAGCAGWGYGATRLWRNTILPRLDPKERG